jgi:uncharacterized protein (DUF1697 family)
MTAMQGKIGATGSLHLIDNGQSIKENEEKPSPLGYKQVLIVNFRLSIINRTPMSSYIAFLRGIGGARTLPVKPAIAALQDAGLKDVRSYIATGNFIFTSRKKAPQLAQDIEGCIEAEFGFFSKAFVLPVETLQQAIHANPFPQGHANHKSLHLFFLAEPAKHADLNEMNRIKAPTEQFALKKQVFYFYAPDGFGKSKLAVRIEKLLGVATTARNWRTVNRVLEIAQEISE